VLSAVATRARGARLVRPARTLAALALLACSALAHGAEDWVYVTRAGDNLWDLSKRYLRHVGYFHSLRAYNAIDEPERIAPGQLIRMPVRWLKVGPATAEVLNVAGEAVVVRQGSAGPEPLAVGDRLHSGDRVRTGAGSNLLIQFADGSRTLVQADGDVAMDSLRAYGQTGMADTRIDVDRGRVDSRVTPASGPGSRFRITTPSAIAAVRGTRFRVEADVGAGLARGEVVEGEIAVDAAGAGRSVPAGFGVVVAGGTPPPPPVSLLPAPDVADIAPRQERTLLELEWPPVAGGAAYRAQLFAGSTPDILLEDAVVETAAVQWDAPPDGEYLLQVRAIDARGLEGLDALRPFVLDARPVPPILLGPRDASAHRQGTGVELWWAVPAEAERFHLQVAGDAAFENILVDEPALAGDRLTLPASLGPGSYQWRVSTRSRTGEQGPFGPPRRLRIQAVPESPGQLPPAVGETGIEVAWGAARAAVSYEYQLARDPEFEDVIDSGTTTETRATLSKPGSGTYYFRSRGVSDEGVTGAYTSGQAIKIPSKPVYWWIFLLPLLLLL
jgi:hypothetical protein